MAEAIARTWKGIAVGFLEVGGDGLRGLPGVRALRCGAAWGR